MCCQVGVLTARIIHLKVGTKTVQYQGRNLETQTSVLEDCTGKIKLKLWEDQVGSVSHGETYTFTQLNTREFTSELFLTTTKQTTVEKVAPLPGLGPIPPPENKEEDRKSVV